MSPNPDFDVTRGRTLVITNPHLPLQNGLNRKVHGITMRRGRWPSVHVPEGLKIGFAPSLGCTRHPASGQVCVWMVHDPIAVSRFMAHSPLKSQCRPWCGPSGIMIRGFVIKEYCCHGAAWFFSQFHPIQPSRP